MGKLRYNPLTMKACLSIFLFYLLAGIDVYSQNRECVLSNLYETKVYDVKPLFGGKWAVAIQDLSVPAALGEEYFSIAIVDSLGRLDKMIPTLFPVSYTHLTLPTSDLV